MMKFFLGIALGICALSLSGCFGNKEIAGRSDEVGLISRSFGTVSADKLDLSELQVAEYANYDRSMCTDLSEEGFYARKAYFSGDGSQLLILGNDNTRDEIPSIVKVKALDGSGLADGERHFKDGITSAAISENGRFIAVATGKREIKVLDAKDQALKNFIPGKIPDHDLLVTAIAFAPGENLGTMRILTGFSDGYVIQWKIRGDELKKWSYRAKQWHNGALTDAKYAQDDIGILTQSDYLVKVWSTSQKEDTYFYDSFDALKNGRFSPNGTSFIAHTSEDSVMFWPNKKYATETVNLTESQGVKWMSVSDDFALTVTNDDVIKIWNAKTGEAEKTITAFKDQRIDKVELSPQGDGIVIGFRNAGDAAVFYDIVNDQQVMTLPVKGILNSIHFSKNGKHFFVMDQQNKGIVSPTPLIPFVKP